MFLTVDSELDVLFTVGSSPVDFAGVFKAIVANGDFGNDKRSGLS